MKTVPPFVAVIKNSHFRSLWLAQIASQVALNIFCFVLAITVYQKTHSNAAVSFMLLSFSLPAIIFGVVAGGIVDHFDKRSVLIFANFSRFVLLFTCFLFSPNLVALFALSILLSVATQLFIPAEAPSIPQLVSEKELLTANSLFTISYYLSTVTGFIFAGTAVKIFGFPNVYLLVAFLMFLAFLFVWRLPKMELKKEKDNFRISFAFIGQSIDEGIKFVEEKERVRQSLVLMTFSQVLITMLAVLAPGFADQTLAIDLTDTSSAILGPAALGLVVGAFLIGEYGRYFLKGTLILIGILGSGLDLIFLSFLTKAASSSFFWLDNLTLAIGLLFFLGFFNAFINVPANTILQQDSEKEMRGRVYGILTSLTGGVSFLPVVFSGILADVLGVGKTLTLLGLFVFSAGIYHYFQRKK